MNKKSFHENIAERVQGNGNCAPARAARLQLVDSRASKMHEALAKCTRWSITENGDVKIGSRWFVERFQCERATLVQGGRCRPCILEKHRTSSWRLSKIHHPQIARTQADIQLKWVYKTNTCTVCFLRIERFISADRVIHTMVSMLSP